ncbi:MAG: cytochrome P450 [Actinomycetota bacterium]|nr:cytochrome P450 [Actinomycetota bacterium]
MSVSEATRTSRNGSGDLARAGSGGLPEASIAESAKVLVAGMLPAVVRGLFKPRRGAMKHLTAIDADRRTVEVLSEIKRRHPGQGVRLLGGRMVVLWGPDAIREVLDRSADLYDAGSGAKEKGMSHFQPDALTLSHGEEWRDRRAFTESVLATSEKVHPAGDRFVAVVADEVERLRLEGTLGWSHWEELFDRVALRVIFGDRARDDQRLTELLEELMAKANRIAVGEAESSDDYHELHGRMEWHLRDPEPGSLVARFADAPQTDRTRVVHQIPHWIFATRDTLAMNAFRALAVIAASEEVEERVREELERDERPYLEGCLGEAMRLWPTTPLLARETTRSATLAGEELDEGTQVMILNTFNHRDTDEVPDANRFRPERWAEGGRDYRFNHLSNGSQDCPGGPLVYLLGTAALAHTLARWDLTLKQPSLDPSGDMPYMLDFFGIEFEVRPRP